MKKKSILLSWGISYLVILLIPIAIGAAVFAESRSLLEEEVGRSNMVLLSQVQETIDSQIRDIGSIGTQLTVDPQLGSFINHAAEPDARWRLMAIDLIRNFRAIRTGNGLIREMYLYIKDADLALSSSTLASGNTIYDMFYDGTGETKENWAARMRNAQTGEFRKMKVLSEDQRIEETLVYMQPFPIKAAGPGPSVLVVMLDPERFQQAIDKMRLDKESTVMILDRDGSALFATGPIENPYSLLDGSLLDETNDAGDADADIATAVLNGESVTVSQISSGLQDWKYVSIVPTRIYARKLLVIRNITAAGVAGGLLLGGAAAWWFTRRNYRPLGRIMNSISDNVKWKLERPGDEFGILQSVLTRTWEERDRFALRFKEQQTMLRGSLLAKLLKGRLRPGEERNGELERLGLSFESDRFAVLLVHIENYDGLFRARQPQDEEGRLQFVHLILSNVLEEMLGAAGPVYSAELNGRLAFLANMKRETDAEESAAGEAEESAAKLSGTGEAEEARIVRIAEEAQRLIESRFLIRFSAGVSGIGHGIPAIADCRGEAEEALEYRLILGIGQIIGRERIRRPKEELYYPLDLERQLVNYIATGNYARSTEVMNEILMTNFAGEPLSVELARCLMFELIGTILKATGEIKADDEAEASRRSELIRSLFACETFEEIEAGLLNVLETVCQDVHERKRSHNEELKEQLIEFIRENHADVNLGLTSISERFRFHPTYVSKYFKEQTGLNLIDYINQYRVSRAKKILENEDSAVQEVSERVGFLNSSSFIRVFKKYEGITPGQYKQKSRLVHR
ncbi:AraC family transcriptional regulator [Saccharibacillus sp. CPCC 101409]|uniref:AraC family transcriptional regulator n=1 Tax=Saccharibacillus sp. CPCC 101409 TaxID=3058041 RepID=UPI002672A32E|nr:AraC family transcriptional regulator [Saccharibacillus sp. CPCC 101409]MDO3412484.1 AraC family transcriptional regulator [Saccharibacillus sp. CPCC 101409]